MERQPNRSLESLLAATGWSNAGLARRVNAACHKVGTPRSYAATSVANWLRGMVPADPVPRILAELFSAQLRRGVSLRALGLPEGIPLDLGLRWEPTATAAVGTVVDLWASDARSDSPLLGAEWIASAFAAPSREWLLGWFDENLAHHGDRRVGAPEVEVVTSMCAAFSTADHRLGGGYARATLIHYFNEIVRPLLGGSYSHTIGRQLLAAAARLCDLGGFMAFDSGCQGLGQRYYIQALRLARASGDHALGAHILTDMAMQAHYLGDALEAVSLARAAHRAALDAGSRASAARCLAIEARAHARLGDARRCAEAMGRAERAMDGLVIDDEPLWIRFFTHIQLHAEFTYASADLGRTDDVQRFAAVVTSATSQMDRRKVLVAATLASSFVNAAGDASRVDVDQACAALRSTTPLLASLTTRRGVEAVNATRRKLRPFGHLGVVQELEAELRPLIGAVA
ncbi:hypothetical protein R8Z50_31155 [Longispora sp. K20-0274]|uniref:hypothetical protein n=1 Tax=Longispora sp. K20-0274 TaxID=3088255 RepID=UPI00399A3B1C